MAIRLVETAFDRVATARQWRTEETREVQAAVLQARVPVDLVEAVHGGGDSLLNVLFQRSSDVSLRGRVKSWAGVLQAWVQNCQRDEVGFGAGTEHGGAWTDGRKGGEDADETEWPEEIRKSRPSLDRGAAKSRVDRQKESILRCLKKQDWSRVEREVSELVAAQLEAGGPEYACKSLCDLAQRAQENGHFRLHREWSQQAVELCPEDAWAWSQLGHAQRMAGNWEEALAAYSNASAFGNHGIGATGRAETLKSLGRYEEALSSYDAVIREFPCDVVARNGRAETLKSLG
ncbi:MAG: tetratricopeptide repeat protein, partial [Planctomycetaceae bacterium]